MFVVKDRDWWFTLEGWTGNLNEATRFPSQDEAVMCMKARGYDDKTFKYMNEEAARGSEKK